MPRFVSIKLLLRFASFQIQSNSLGWHLAASSGWFGECAFQPRQAVDGGHRSWCCCQGGGCLTFHCLLIQSLDDIVITNNQVKPVCSFHQCQPKGVLHQLPDKHGRLRHHRSHKVRELLVDSLNLSLLDLKR